MAIAMVPTKRLLLALLVAATSAAGCAENTSKYPSLSIRQAERVSGTFQPPSPEPAPPAPPEPAVLDRLDSLRADAANANARFLTAAKNAQGPMAAAANAAPGSESWSVAQIALAQVSSARSDTMKALADLDRIYVNAVDQGNDLSRITEVRNEVQTVVDSEDRTLAGLERP